MPSSRLSCSVRWLSVRSAARMRARSSRSSRATTWNLVRTEGVTRPRRAASSTSRAIRASTEMTSPLWRGRCCFRGALRRAPVWRWPGRAKDSSFRSCRGAVATAAYGTVPPTGRETSRAEGLVLRTPSRRADPQGRHAAPRQSSREPGAVSGWADGHGTGEVVVRRPVRFPGTSSMVTRATAHNSPGPQLAGSAGGGPVPGRATRAPGRPAWPPAGRCRRPAGHGAPARPGPRCRSAPRRSPGWRASPWTARTGRRPGRGAGPR